MRLKKPNLITQIFIGMFIGILLGHFAPNWSQNLQVLSDIFLRLIKMIIAPLVFATLVVGIAKLGDFKVVGRIGLKTILYFQFATLLSLTLGLILVNIFKPGLVMDLSVIKMATASETSGIQSSIPTFSEFISHLIPTSVAEAMSKNEILPLVVFSIFFGVATAAMGAQGKIVIDFFDAVGHIMYKITGYVMKFAPLGVMGAIAAVVSKQGIGILNGYIYLIACFYGGLLFFMFIILGGICFSIRIPFFKLLRYLQGPILLAFSTASSESAFPKTVASLERFGCSNRIISFVLPLGYSFNLDGSIMYMTFATMFIAQAYGIHIGLQQQIVMMLVLLVTSKGMAGVPRASLVVIAGTLTHFNIPAEGLLLLLGIDQMLDMGRSAINVMGNAVATVVISKWEKELGPSQPLETT